MNQPKHAEIESILEEFSSLVYDGDQEQAEVLLEYEVTQYPNSVDLISHLGYFYYITGQYSKALPLFEKRNQLAAPDKSLCKILGEIHYCRREPDQAKSWYKQALKKKDYSFETFKRLLYLTLREWEHRLFHLVVPRSSFQKTVSFIKRKLFELSLLCVAFFRWIPFLKPHNHLYGFLQFINQHDPETKEEGYAYHKTREACIANQNLPTQANPTRVLDIGTGKNTLPLYWAQKGYDVVSLDGSLYEADRLRTVKQKVETKHAPLPFQFLAGDGCELPFAEGIFDAVTILCVLEHMPEEADIRCMLEIHRVLKPGGQAILSVETAQTPSEYWMRADYEIGYQMEAEETKRKSVNQCYLRNYNPETMVERLVDSAGWERIEQGYYDNRLLPFRSLLDPMSHKFLSALLGPMQPLLSLLFYRKTTEEKLSPSSLGYLILKK
ncbi:methyltransferase domain-containing protein [bacterium]|nr:methyltransferase domain-containing protein [bacterium]